MKVKSTATLMGALVVLIAGAMTPGEALAKGARISEPGRFGLGLGIGALAYGLSAKNYLSEGGSVQGNIGVQPTANVRRDGTLLALGADYLFEFGPLTSANNIDLGFTLGPGFGAAVSTLGYVALDVNACLGFAFLFHDINLDLAFEYRPALRVKSLPLYGTPGRVDLVFSSFGLQMRYYLEAW